MQALRTFTSEHAGGADGFDVSFPATWHISPYRPLRETTGNKTCTYCRASVRSCQKNKTPKTVSSRVLKYLRSGNLEIIMNVLPGRCAFFHCHVRSLDFDLFWAYAAVFFRGDWKKLAQIPHNHDQPQTDPSGPQCEHLDHHIPLVAQVPYHLHSFNKNVIIHACSESDFIRRL